MSLPSVAKRYKSRRAPRQCKLLPGFNAGCVTTAIDEDRDAPRSLQDFYPGVFPKPAKSCRRDGSGFVSRYVREPSFIRTRRELLGARELRFHKTSGASSGKERVLRTRHNPAPKRPLDGNDIEQILRAAPRPLRWVACSALRAKDAFVAQAGRLFGAPLAGAPGTCASRKTQWLKCKTLYTRRRTSA